MKQQNKLKERDRQEQKQKNRDRISCELDELNKRLEETGGSQSAQLELNRKRESESAKLRKDLEEARIQNEAATAHLKKSTKMQLVK